MLAAVFPTQDEKSTERWSRQGLYRNETLTDWLERAAAEFADEPAIVSLGNALSYRDLYTKVRGFAAGLQSLGLGKSDVIAIQLPNMHEFIISYLAIAYIGGIVQTLHMPYRKSELLYLLNDSRAAAVICLEEFKNTSPTSNMLEIAGSMNASMQVISVGSNVAGTADFDSLAMNKTTPCKVDTRADDLFVLLYTSGTTAMPKGVPHRYNGFLTNARSCSEAYGFTCRDKLLSVAPMTHLYGLFALNMTLASAGTSVLLPTFSPQRFIDVVKTRKPTAIFAGPAHFSSCFQAGLFRPEDFDDTRFICLSGSHVPNDLAKKVDKLLVNGKVVQLWGMTELQAGAITRLSDPEHVRLNTTGRATAGTELRIVSDDDLVLSPDEEGELQVRGLSVCAGYLHKPEESGKAFTGDGWFKTGDTAVIDECGNLKITGRTKSLINRGGVKYNPVEIEELVNGLQQVSQCAILPVPDEVLGERACIVVVLDEGKTLTLEDVCTALDSAGIAKYKWPEQLQIIDSMPLTPTNKIKLDELRKSLFPA